MPPQQSPTLASERLFLGDTQTKDGRMPPKQSPTLAKVVVVRGVFRTPYVIARGR